MRPDLRWRLAVVGVLLLPGCAVIDQQQTALNQISAEVKALSADLAVTEKAMIALHDDLGAGRTQVTEELSRIRAGLEAVSARPACPAPAPPEPAPLACEPTPAGTAPAALAMPDQKVTAGAEEVVRIEPQGIALPARVDTGAETSSLHAQNIRKFERDGDDWVRFDVPTEEGPISMERELLHHVRVYQQSDRDGTRRPVVYMRVRVGDIRGAYEFNLSDRSHLKHPVILGRNFLQDLIVVDVSQTHLLSARPGSH